MTQLSYQPAFDPYHAVYRLLRLRDAIFAKRPLHEDQLKILDFYLLFPFRIEGMRLNQGHRRYRKLSRDFSWLKPYGELPEDRVLFGRMEPIQIAALDTLANKNLIEGELYKTGTVSATEDDIPDSLRKRIKADNEAQAELISFLLVLATEYDLLGGDGLKDRSKLMDHRYDAI